MAQIVHWSEEEQAFVPGLAPMRPHGKIKYISYRRPSLSWSHSSEWQWRVTKEYQRWVEACDARNALDSAA
jgi:hypothetical protein